MPFHTTDGKSFGQHKCKGIVKRSNPVFQTKVFLDVFWILIISTSFVDV